jgi:hypothetical protein
MNGRCVAHPMSGLPDIGIYLRKSAKADLRWLVLTRERLRVTDRKLRTFVT